MLKIQSLSKSYDHRQVFDEFNLTVKRGQFVALMGANGIGKTTLLNVLAGLTIPDKGEIELSSKSHSRQRISYMMQNHHSALYPWLSVRENIALPLRYIGYSKKQRDKAVSEVVGKYDIRLPLDRYPYQLSGGQKQLTLLLQSIINKPSLILMDEPFSALDLITSKKIQSKLVEMWQSEKPTVIYISHRIEDAVYLANRIIVLSADPAQIMLDIENTLKYPRESKAVGNKEFSSIYQKLEQTISDL